MLRFSFFAMALLSAPIAHAEPDQQGRMEIRRVSYADLDLSNEKGRATLHRRVKIAVSQVCGDPQYGDFDHTRHVMRCRADAHRRALAQVETAIAKYNNNRPSVTLAER